MKRFITVIMPLILTMFVQTTRTSMGGRNEMTDPEDEGDLKNSSLRSLSAQERFQLAKQAEKRYLLI